METSALGSGAGFQQSYKIFQESDGATANPSNTAGNPARVSDSLRDQIRSKLEADSLAKFFGLYKRDKATSRLLARARDMHSWIKIHGIVGATAIAVLGKRSVWTAQAEVLSSPHQLGNLGGDPREPSNGHSHDPSPFKTRGPTQDFVYPREPADDFGLCDRAAREFKEIVQLEVQRVSLSVCLQSTSSLSLEIITVR